MITRIITLALVILGLAGGGYAAYNYTTTPEPIKEAEVVEEAWIEVTTAPVYHKAPERAIELHSGDVVTKGMTIETGRTGKAVIHFPDGSVLRLDRDTIATLSDIHFKTDDHSLTVSIHLAVGRVWSKVVSLATPESSWEVETSNTVATVRGTAFGVSFAGGVSKVLGSENKIAVSVIDPDTKERIKTTEVILEENKIVEITDKEVVEARTGKPILAARVVSASQTILNETWIKEAKEADRKFDVEVESIKREAGKAEIKDLREVIIHKAEEKREIIREERKEKEIIKKPVVDPKQPERKTTDLDTPPRIENSAPSSIIRTGTETREGRLIVKSERDSLKLKEGETIAFRAILQNDNTETDVTSQVVWEVIGQIGTVRNSGIFTAQLGAEVSELGEAVGFVTAHFTGNNNMSRSELISVQLALLESPIDIGGQ